MGSRIVYQLAGQAVTILIPCECGLTLVQIGKKDVPTGAPFWIVDSNEIPPDRSLRNAWMLDTESMGDPDGVGGSDV